MKKTLWIILVIVVIVIIVVLVSKNTKEEILPTDLPPVEETANLDDQAVVDEGVVITDDTAGTTEGNETAATE